MTRNIRALNRGRLYIWWVSRSRRRDLVVALQLLFVVAAFLAVSTWDYHDQLAYERFAKEDVQRILEEERRARELPKTVYVIEAKTPEKAQERLAQIAGELDLERAKMKGLVPR